jgi:hypothetical protein
MADPKQLHVSAAQSSHNQAVGIRNCEKKYMAVAVHVFVKSVLQILPLHKVYVNIFAIDLYIKVS